jgi:hypothetical protein
MSMIRGCDVQFLQEAQRILEQSEKDGATPSAGVKGTDDTESAVELAELMKRCKDAELRKDKAIEKRDRIREKMHEGATLRDALNSHINTLERRYREAIENLASAEKNNGALALQLDKSMQLNILNDAFYVWYSGPYGTINNFRVGNVPLKPIEWSEINTALGETALALSVIVSKIPRSQFRFTKYGLYPMGGYSKVYRIEGGSWWSGAAGSGSNTDDGDTEAQQSSGHALGARSLMQNPYKVPQGTTLVNLYMDLNATFSLFPKSKFNAAIYGLMYCIYELGEYIGKHDPPLSLPYSIDVGDGSGRTCTISTRTASPAGGDSTSNNSNAAASSSCLDLFWSGNASAGAYNDQDEQWTRALKFALSDVKWIIAWSSKHFGTP